MQRVLSDEKIPMGGLLYLLDNTRFQEESAGKKKYYPNEVFTRELMEYLDNYEFGSRRPKKLQKNEVLGITKDFYDKHFKLHDIFIEVGGKLYVGTPFELKVKPDDRLDYGSVNFNFEYLHKVCFDEILLGKKYDYNSVGIYGHELAHTQLERRQKVFYTNYFNREVISIFMEKVIVYETNSKYFDDIKLMRLKMLKKTLDIYKKDVWECEGMKKDSFAVRSYIESTLIANHLFYKYANSDKSHQIKILADIQKVFDGFITVEDLIKIERVGLASSKSLKYIK